MFLARNSCSSIVGKNRRVSPASQFENVEKMFGKKGESC